MEIKVITNDGVECTLDKKIAELSAQIKVNLEANPDEPVTLDKVSKKTLDHIVAFYAHYFESPYP